MQAITISEFNLNSWVQPLYVYLYGVYIVLDVYMYSLHNVYTLLICIGLLSNIDLVSTENWSEHITTEKRQQQVFFIYLHGEKQWKKLLKIHLIYIHYFFENDFHF